MSKTKVNKIYAGVKKVLPNGFARFIRRMGTAILTPIQFSIYTGHFKSSLNEMAIDRNSKPLPWFTYPAIDFIRTRDTSDASVLEFGGGQSTIYWGRNARKVTCFEGSEEWAQHIRKGMSNNCEVFVVTNSSDEQVSEIRSELKKIGEKFDIVVIDGLSRSKIIDLAVEYVSPDGMIICDNAEGYGFQKGFEKHDFMRVDFYGHTPGVIHPHCTSINFKLECKYFSKNTNIYRRAYGLNEFPK